MLDRYEYLEDIIDRRAAATLIDDLEYEVYRARAMLRSLNDPETPNDNDLVAHYAERLDHARRALAALYAAV